MKRILSIAVVGVALMTASCDKQVEDNTVTTVPTTVKDAFAKSFPDQKEVTWEVEGDYIEAEFDVNGMEHTVIYDAEGTQVGSEEEILAEAMPDTSLKYISANHAGAEALEYEKATSEEGTMYTVELKDSTGIVELVFDENGIYKSSEMEDEEDDDLPMEENDLN